MDEQIYPIAVDAVSAAAMFQSSARTWRRWNVERRIPRPHRLGGRVLWLTDELERWAAAGMPIRDAWERMNREGGSHG